MTLAWGGYILIPSLSLNLILESDLHDRGTESSKTKALCHFPSLQSALLAAEGKTCSKESQPNPLFSLIRLPLSFTHLLPISPEERCQSVSKGAWTEWSVSSSQPTRCLAAVAALGLPRSLLRAACHRHSCSATSANIPGFATHLDLLWELPINTTLAEALLQGDIQDEQQLRAPQPRQEKWGTKSSVLFSSHSKLSQV